MLRRVTDLSLEQRRALEALLGHILRDDESVSIRSIYTAAVIPAKLSPEECLLALHNLNARFAPASDEVASVSPEEEESIVNEALRSTRPKYG
jgi:hypothetical protein